jgi:phospholipid/cholesterol/gamma-HCH transport system substrate-binding protein
MIDDLADASASIRRAAGEAQKMAAAGSGGAQAAQAAQAAIGEVQELVQSDLGPALDQARQTAQQTAGAAQGVDRLVSSSRQPVELFTRDGLIEFRHFVAEARQLVQELREIADRLRSDPSRFLLGRDQGGFQPEK